MQLLQEVHSHHCRGTQVVYHGQCLAHLHAQIVGNQTFISSCVSRLISWAMRVLHLVLLVLSDLQAADFNTIIIILLACGIFQWCHSTLTHAHSDALLVLLRGSCAAVRGRVWLLPVAHHSH
jgi:hypothetical protein